MKSTERFSDRVSDYVRYRPSYPQQMVSVLAERCCLTSDSVIVDIGSGTGKLTGLLLNEGYQVIGVEPNAQMRMAAEALLSSHDQFQSVFASAEDTSLDTSTVDLIVAGQAFHWFEPVAAKHEFARILKNDGNIAFIWNQRRVEQPFQKEYDELLNRYCPEYSQSNHRHVTDADIDSFCAPRVVERLEFENHQQFDLAGFLGRMYSSSYTPGRETIERQSLDRAARRLFDNYARGGSLSFEYCTKVFLA
jgi:SAM-dependent methyltransferase